MSSNQRGLAIRVCFIAPKAYPLFNPGVEGVFGGAEVDLYYLATELAKDESFEVSFIVADYGQQAVETIEAVRVIKSLDFNKNALAGAIKVWRALRRAEANIYMMKTITLGVFLVAFFCRLNKKTFVYRSASASVCDGSYRRRHPVLGRIFNWSWGKAELVIVQNVTDQENLKLTTGATSIAIPNGHRLAELAQGERDRILWVGRSAEVKRPELFVKLAEHLPDEKFTFICQRATGDKTYDELVAHARAVKNIEFIERVPFGEIDNYFQRAKVFVNTSDAEGFPNTFIQACRSATPILTWNVNPDGFLDRYGCGFCAGKSWDKFVSQCKMLAEPENMTRYGQAGRKYVEETHDISQIVEEYKKLFRKAL